MKKLTLLLVSFVMVVFTSCSVENETDLLQNKEDNTFQKSFKTVQISFEGEKTTIDVALLKEELAVVSEHYNGTNSFIWKMYNDMTLDQVKELLLFSGQITTVNEVGEQNNYTAREGGETNENDEAEETESKMDTKGDTDTRTDEE